ncbi:aminotransferase class V-fold PLP-dependent enzyme [Sandaracinobacteroides hominis]|uniref:aminotransferase class V-fold PLP-dependent enzyme n=1 Tax=Sandaracinobacteroides hominis TaxID=2780086 RepID=UPI001F3DBA61|nr:aminotransferase class V-fold PLP-dependent enzyme [Sandaracinobacteroides hominis]
MNRGEDILSVSRRALLAGAAALPVAARAAAPRLPDRSTFPGVEGVFLDSGTTHPVSRAARQAIDSYFADRGGTRAGHHMDETETRVRTAFARLVGATPEEIAFVQSTTAGEHAVIDALDLPRAGGRIVTDTLHFFGSFGLYEGLSKLGMDVVWLTPRNNRIPIDAYARAITPGTKLVSLSLVSTYNGFEQDLAKVCEIAHAKGALVYADIIHAAGAVPVNLAATGVDFAACASYKWLMGDFGIGFLYARADRLPHLRRTRWGYYGVEDINWQLPPYTDRPLGTQAARVTQSNNAEGFFATGTRSHAGIIHLDWSLAYLNDLGMDRLVAHRTPMLDRLRAGLLSRGYTVVTPEASRTPLLTVALPDARKRLSDRLKAADVRIMLASNRFRISPSVFNSMDDIDRLLAALPPSGEI